MQKIALFALIVVILLITCFLISGCHVSKPFKGPGYDSATSKVRKNYDRDIVVVVTYGKIDGSSGAFSKHLRSVEGDLSDRSGLIGYSVRKELLGSAVWTLSVWESYGAIQSFLDAKARSDAVQDGGIPRDSVRVVMKEMPADQIPVSWSEATKWLEEKNTDADG